MASGNERIHSEKELVSVGYATWNMCRRKKSYPTYRHALSDENTLRLNKRQQVHIYECPLCGKWHIGHEKEF